MAKRESVEAAAQKVRERLRSFWSVVRTSSFFNTRKQTTPLEKESSFDIQIVQTHMTPDHDRILRIRNAASAGHDLRVLPDVA